jgi:N-acetyl-anhydromuramyl-L-alanine amidase AmpD
MKHLVVHCSATPPKMDIGASTIRRWHINKGWSDIGYHYVIRRNGQIELGRPETRQGAHVKGYNKDSIGICLIGGVDEYNDPENNFTDAQFTTLGGLLMGLTSKYPNAKVLGHRDFPNVAKACPSFNAPEWWYSYEHGAIGANT